MIAYLLFVLVLLVGGCLFMLCRINSSFCDIGTETDEPGCSKPHDRPATKRDLEEMETRIMATQAEIEAGLNRMTTQIGKVATEQATRFDALTARIKELEDAINNGDVRPEVATALANAQASLQSLDDVIPDAPAPTPT